MTSPGGRISLASSFDDDGVREHIAQALAFRAEDEQPVDWSEDFEGEIAEEGFAETARLAGRGVDHGDIQGSLTVALAVLEAVREQDVEGGEEDGHENDEDSCLVVYKAKA